MEFQLCLLRYYIALFCWASLFAASENVSNDRPKYLHEGRWGTPQFRHSINAPLSSPGFQSNSPFEEFARPDIARHFSDMRRKRSTPTEENGADISATDMASRDSPNDPELNAILDERPRRFFNNNKKKTDKIKQVETVALKDGSSAPSHDRDERKIGAILETDEFRSVDEEKVGNTEDSVAPMGPPAALQGPDLLDDHANTRDQNLDVPSTSNSMVAGEDIARKKVDSHGISPLLDHSYGGSQTTAQTIPGSSQTPRLSWLAEFLCAGRGPGWLALNIILLILIIFVALLSLFRLLALRSCTSLLSRTLYLFVMILCFTAAAFTAVHLIHLCFGGKEGLPLLLTLVLTHTPVPCLTVALCLILHSILEAAREPWPMSCAALSRVSIVLVLASVAGDVAVSLLHSTALLITCRVTLTAVAILPMLMYLLKYCRIREVHAALRREIQGELKLMVPPSKDSVAYEQRCAQYLLRDILSKWATVMLLACIVAIVLWGCNLSLSVFFAVSRVPVWLWWFCHTTNVLFQIILIVLLIISCVITLDGRYPTLWHKIFSVPKDVFNPPASGSPNGKRNFVYERVSYSSGPESSQRTSSSQNETDDSDTRVPVSLNPQSTPPIRPRVTLQRSATFNCAPRMPVIYGYHPGYPHLLPPYYQRAGSFAQIHQHQAMPSSMLVNEAGFVRFNMPIQNFAYPQPMQPHNLGEMMKENDGIILTTGDPSLFHPNVDIEYNSLRRFPRRYAGGPIHNIPEDQGARSKFNPPEIRKIAPSSSAGAEQMDPATFGAGSAPVSPYHALSFLPTYTPSIIQAPAMTSFHPTSPSSASSELKNYMSPPALPSRAGSFRNHYAPQASPASSPLSSPYQPLSIGSGSFSANQSFQRSPSQLQSPVSLGASPYHALPPSKQRSSRPTSPSIHSLAFPPPPPVPDNSPTRIEDQLHTRGDAIPRQNVLQNPTSSYSHSGLGQDLFKAPLSYSVSQANTPRNTNQQNNKLSTAAELELHEEKTIENTVRDILSSCERPVIRPRKQHNSGRLPRHNQSFRRDDPQSIYANGSSANEFGEPSAAHIAMDVISKATPYSINDDEMPSDDAKTSVPSIKRNHSTAGCYYPKDRKDSFCQTDDEGNKYSSFRLSQLRTKPADWYGTWAGRRKSKNGAYSVDSEKGSAEVPSIENRNSEKRLSSSRASSIISIYNKMKSRKEKPPKDDSSESTEKDDRDDTEMSQASTFDDTPTPSEKTDDVSIATEEDKDLENPLADVLDEIKEKTQNDADWTMDILSSSTVLSDFYKLKSDRPSPLPELSEVDG